MKTFRILSLLSVIGISLLLSGNAFAQETGQSKSYDEVEIKPTFQGGSAQDFAVWTMGQIKYPEEAKKAKIGGRAYVSFVIDTEGKVVDVRLLRGTGHESLDNEVLRVVKSSPDWTPGEVKGEKVKVTFVFPVIFKLD